MRRCSLWKVQDLCSDVKQPVGVRSVRDVNMRVKRVFLAAMFCCYISISRLMQIRSVLDQVLTASLSFWYSLQLCLLFLFI